MFDPTGGVLLLNFAWVEVGFHCWEPKLKKTVHVNILHRKRQYKTPTYKKSIKQTHCYINMKIKLIYKMLKISCGTSNQSYIYRVGEYIAEGSECNLSATNTWQYKYEDKTDI